MTKNTYATLSVVEENGPHDPQQSFLQQLERVDLLLQQQILPLRGKLADIFEDFLLPPALLTEHIAQYTQSTECSDMRNYSAALHMDDNSRLGQLTRRFTLSHFERDALLMCLLPHYDTRYALLFAELQGNAAHRQPGRDLLLSLITPAFEQQVSYHNCFTIHGPLFEFALLKSEKKTILTEGLYANAATYHYLLGQNDLPEELLICGQWLTPLMQCQDPHSDFTHQIRAILTATDVQERPIVLLQGTEKSGRGRAIARAAALERMPTFVLNGELLSDKNIDNTLQVAIRETCLRGGCLVLRNFNELAGSHQDSWSRFCNRIRAATIPAFCLNDRHDASIRFNGFSHLQLSMPSMTADDKSALLQSELAGLSVASDIDIAAIIRRYNISPDNITQVIQEASLYSKQRGDDAVLSEADLRRALTLHSQQNFGKLAQRINVVRHFGDLVVSPELLIQLKEVLAAIKYREDVMAQGFSRKIGGTCGISALFFGDSGTGKTMAAEVMANELGVDLIKIDLSTVVNKYIGETEKNLAKIFDLAAMDSGVLFFDEADALFGKRSETKDAKDRHANIQVSYLLQRLETYPGLVILSTNNRSHLDSAFNRRITFMLRFAQPDVAERIQLWRSIWPEDIRLASDVNLEQLAQQYKITGANISNIALLATWLAADEGATTIANSHIRLALKRELGKIGRLVS
ncbi:MAG: ATP-binding protein [Rhodobacteraceae bacterium]|nr:ATP-binding protein [Paracoccaceae bacterium]